MTQQQNEIGVGFLKDFEDIVDCYFRVFRQFSAALKPVFAASSAKSFSVLPFLR